MATLEARTRDGRGKGAARKLRGSGRVPAVAYGHGQESRPLSVSAHELQKLLGTINPENTIIDLKIEGAQTVKALIREIQHHPSRPFIQHIDFFEIKAGEKLHVEIPIRLHGTPIGVREGGGVLQEVLREVSVECLPEDIPAGVDLDVGNLQVGDSIHVSDVQLERVTILNDPAIVICTVSIPTGPALPEDAEAAPAEPELVRPRGGEEGES